MKRIALAVLTIALGVTGLTACRRSPEMAGGARTDAAAPEAPDLDGLQVEIRPQQIPTHMAPGSQAEIRLEVKNVGTKPWPASGEFPLHFGYHWEAPGADGNWTVVVWDDSNRAGLEADVPSGGTVNVTLPIKAPPTACPSCRIVIAPLLEMKSWSGTVRSIAQVNIS